MGIHLAGLALFIGLTVTVIVNVSQTHSPVSLWFVGLMIAMFAGGVANYFIAKSWVFIGL